MDATFDLGSTNGIENRPFPTFAERLDRLILERALDGFLVSKVATEDGVLSMRFVWSGCPLNEVEPHAPRDASRGPRGPQKAFVGTLRAVLRLELRRDDPRGSRRAVPTAPAVESVSIVVHSGVGLVPRRGARRDGPRHRHDGEEAIQKAVLSEDPAFYGSDELGICVFDMNAGTTTRPPRGPMRVSGRRENFC